MAYQLDLTGVGLDEVLRLMAFNTTNDSYLESLFRKVKQERADLWLDVQDEFSIIASFYEDSSNSFIRRLSARLIRKNKYTKLFELIMSENEGDLEGVELESGCGSYVVFSKDASIKGHYRWTCFDNKGFAGHYSDESWDSVLRDAIFTGFTKPCKGKLEECFLNFNGI